MEWITDPEAWIALATLTALEIVLGIDNIIFLSIVVGRLDPHQRQLGRILGLGGAMVTRDPFTALTGMDHAINYTFVYPIRAGDFRAGYYS